MKTILVAVVLLLASALPACAENIPSKIVEWSQTNVWRVHIAGGFRGTAFWLDNDTVVTACHVVPSYVNEGTIRNLDSSITLKWRKLTCDKATDIALLDIGDDKKGFTPLKSRLSTEVPDVGAEVWGAGFPAGAPLFITHGHWQQVSFDGERYHISAPTHNGDSGSPVLTLRMGKVYIEGIRQAVWGYNRRFSPQPDLVDHMVTISHSTRIIKRIKELFL